MLNHPSDFYTKVVSGQFSYPIMHVSGLAA